MPPLHSVHNEPDYLGVWEAPVRAHVLETSLNMEFLASHMNALFFERFIQDRSHPVPERDLIELGLRDHHWTFVQEPDEAQDTLHDTNDKIFVNMPGPRRHRPKQSEIFTLDELGLHDHDVADDRTLVEVQTAFCPAAFGRSVEMPAPLQYRPDPNENPNLPDPPTSSDEAAPGRQRGDHRRPCAIIQPGWSHLGTCYKMREPRNFWRKDRLSIWAPITSVMKLVQQEENRGARLNSNYEE